MAAKKLLGDQLDVGMRTNKYRDDETLVLYRSGREYVNQGLMPKFEVGLDTSTFVINFLISLVCISIFGNYSFSLLYSCVDLL